MILSSILDFDRYEHLHPLFPAVGRFLRGTDLDALPEGRTDIQGDRLFVLASPQAHTRPGSEAPLEVHRRYIDVQVVLEGLDTMGWCPIEHCHGPRGDFDTARDLHFFDDAPVAYVPVPPGDLAVFFPEDAHAPLIGDGAPVRKLVIKVALEG